MYNAYIRDTYTCNFTSRAVTLMKPFHAIVLNPVKTVMMGVAIILN